MNNFEGISTDAEAQRATKSTVIERKGDVPPRIAVNYRGRNLTPAESVKICEEIKSFVMDKNNN